MKNYKTTYTNPETFETTEIETMIPINLVNDVKRTLDDIEGYLITPALINSDDNSIVFGIMDMSDRTLKYQLSITPNN